MSLKSILQHQKERLRKANTYHSLSVALELQPTIIFLINSVKNCEIPVIIAEKVQGGACNLLTLERCTNKMFSIFAQKIIALKIVANYFVSINLLLQRCTAYWCFFHWNYWCHCCHHSQLSSFIPTAIHFTSTVYTDNTICSYVIMRHPLFLLKLMLLLLLLRRCYLRIYSRSYWEHTGWWGASAVRVICEFSTMESSLVVH